MLKTILAAAAIGYLGLAAYLYLFQRSYIYYPAFTRPTSVPTNLELVRDGVTLRGWEVNPGRPRALLYFGGNAERLEHNIADFEALLPDYTVYMLAYRGYGASEGSPTEEALTGDALALFDRVGPRHAEVAVMGRSLGSAVAVTVAAARGIKRLVLVTPFDSLASVGRRAFPIFPVGWLLKDRYRAVDGAPAVEAPTLILYAERDRIVPRDSVRRLAGAFPPGQVETVEIRGAGHNDIHGDPRYRDRLAAFLQE